MRCVLISALIVQLVGAANCDAPEASCDASAQSLLQLAQKKEARVKVPQRDFVAVETNIKLPPLSQVNLRDTSGSGISTEMQDVLDWHNTFRCMHGVPYMEWDTSIAANAQAWADLGNFEHGSVEDLTLEGYGRLGENLAWGSPSYTGVESTQAWYWEVTDTDGSPDNCSDTVPANLSKPICHYTQVVWKGSTKLGCGKGRATHNGAEGDFWVCQYFPAGNTVGSFSDNVNAAVSTQAACESGTAPTPAPPTTPPPPTEAAPSSGGGDGASTITCVDKPTACSPHISTSNGIADCSELSGWCSMASISGKCPATCGEVCHCEDGAPTDSPAYTWQGTTTYLTCAEMASQGLCSDTCVQHKCKVTCNYC